MSRSLSRSNSRRAATVPRTLAARRQWRTGIALAALAALAACGIKGPLKLPPPAPAATAPAPATAPAKPADPGASPAIPPPTDAPASTKQ